MGEQAKELTWEAIYRCVGGGRDGIGLDGMGWKVGEVSQSR